MMNKSGQGSIADTLTHNRAPALGAGGRGFESRRPDIRKTADYQVVKAW